MRPVVAPITGIVDRILVDVGNRVEPNQELPIIESIKMFTKA